jgi:hypothetical protein
MNTWQPRTVLRLIVVYVTLLGIMRFVGDSYCRLWLPLLRAELSWLLPANALVDVSLAMRAGEQVYLAQIALNRALVGSPGSVGSDVFTVSVLSGSVVQSLLIVLSLVLANVGRNVWQCGLTLFGVMMVLTMLGSVDVPLVMLGTMNDLLCEQQVSACLHTSILASYGSALERGGRLAMAVLGACLLIEIVARRK